VLTHQDVLVLLSAFDLTRSVVVQLVVDLPYGLLHNMLHNKFTINRSK